MSEDWPWKPPVGWWMSIRPLGSVWRLPGAPAVSSSAPIDIATPQQIVCTSRRDVLHRVVDREAGVDDAARAVDVQRDVAVGVGGLEVQQLRDDEVRDLVVDRLAEEDDALVEQPAVDVERALAAPVLLDDHRDEGHVPDPFGSQLIGCALRAPAR